MSEINRYELLDKIGEGTVSMVFRAHDPGTGRKIALKVLKDSSNPDAQAAFIKEIRVIGKLNHHNIVTIYDVGEHEGLPYIAMELIEGQFLDQLLSSGKHFSWPQVVDMAKQLASALDYAHHQSILHGDIKPANVAWNASNSKITLTDFATVNQHNIYETVTLKSHQVNASTPYLSPEQVQGQKSDHRSDLFSLGALLYQLLTGKKPFEGDGFEQLATEITQRAHKAISVSVTQAPEQFIKIIDKLLYKNPEDRFQTAGELLTALEELPDKNIVLPNPAQGRRTLLISASGLAVVCIGILVWVFQDNSFQDNSKPDSPIANQDQTSATKQANSKNSETRVKIVKAEQQLTSLQASLNQRLSKFECSSLTAFVKDNKDVDITGHVSIEDDMIALMDLMDGYPGVSNVSYEVSAIKWPFCQAIAILSQDKHSNISGKRGLAVANNNPDKQVTTNNQLNFKVTSPDFESYLYVDYYREDGTVIHMYSGGENERSPRTKALTSFQLSETAKPDVLGESLIVVMATFNPMQTGTRPKEEPAQDYLSELHRLVVVNRIELAADYLILEKVPGADS